jgi:hypothetical protein
MTVGEKVEMPANLVSGRETHLPGKLALGDLKIGHLHLKPKLD